MNHYTAIVTLFEAEGLFASFPLSIVVYTTKPLDIIFTADVMPWATRHSKLKAGTMGVSTKIFVVRCSKTGTDLCIIH